MEEERKEGERFVVRFSRRRRRVLAIQTRDAIPLALARRRSAKANDRGLQSFPRDVESNRVTRNLRSRYAADSQAPTSSPAAPRALLLFLSLFLPRGSIHRSVVDIGETSPMHTLERITGSNSSHAIVATSSKFLSIMRAVAASSLAFKK